MADFFAAKVLCQCRVGSTCRAYGAATNRRLLNPYAVDRCFQFAERPFGQRNGAVAHAAEIREIGGVAISRRVRSSLTAACLQRSASDLPRIDTRLPFGKE
jgi:hypothetical protein